MTDLGKPISKAEIKKNMRIGINEIVFITGDVFPVEDEDKTYWFTHIDYVLTHLDENDKEVKQRHKISPEEHTTLFLRLSHLPDTLHCSDALFLMYKYKLLDERFIILGNRIYQKNELVASEFSMRTEQ
jgi:hypothetical protein